MLVINIYRSLTSCVGICYASGVHAESGFGIILTQVVPRPFFCGYVLTTSISSTAVRLLSILLRAYMHTCLPVCGHAGLLVYLFVSMRACMQTRKHTSTQTAVISALPGIVLPLRSALHSLSCPFQTLFAVTPFYTPESGTLSISLFLRVSLLAGLHANVFAGLRV